MENYNLLKQLRQTKGISQETMARIVDVSLRHYQNIECDKSIPSIYIGLKIAKHLNIEPIRLWNIDTGKIER